MLDWLSINRTFVVIGLIVLIGFMLPIENVVKLSKYESLKVPQFELPTDLQVVKSDISRDYPNIKTEVFLGDTVSSQKIASKQKRAYPRLRLKAIMIDGDLKVANINGAMMKVGGSIYKHRILNITDSGVLIDGPSGKRKLVLR